MGNLKIFGWVVLGFLGVSLAALVIKVVLFPVGVAHKAVNSANGVISKTLDSNNVIASYEWFHDVNAQFNARMGQIKGHKKLIEVESDSKEKSRLNIELSSMRQSCRDMAARYNANSQKVNKNIFKGDSLPEMLSLNDCEA